VQAPRAYGPSRWRCREEGDARAETARRAQREGDHSSRLSRQPPAPDPDYDRPALIDFRNRAHGPRARARSRTRASCSAARLLHGARAPAERTARRTALTLSALGSVALQVHHHGRSLRSQATTRSRSPRQIPSSKPAARSRHILKDCGRRAPTISSRAALARHSYQSSRHTEARKPQSRPLVPPRCRMHVGHTRTRLTRTSSRSASIAS